MVAPTTPQPQRSATLVPGMTDYAREIPEALARAAAVVPAHAAEIARRAGDVLRIELVGSGTSFHAALAVSAELEERLGIEVRARTPQDFLSSPQDRIGTGTLMIGVSQTGRSTGTIRAMTAARQRGAFVVLVAGWPDSAGAASADAVLDIACGPEWVGARTKGYVATLFALLALSDALSGDAAGQDSVAAADLPAAARRVLHEAEEALPVLAGAFDAASAVWMVAYGVGIPTAREGALKMLETVRIPIPVFDLEEYMHGPYHCLERDTHLIFIAPAGAERARCEALIHFVADVSPHVLVIEPADLVADERVLRFGVPAGLHRRFDPLLAVIPLQLLSAELTWRKGREPGVSRYPDFHDRLASKTAAPLRAPSSTSPTETEEK